MEDVEKYIQDFLQNFFKTHALKVYSLAGDASNRRYYRIIHEHESFVLMQWEPFDPKKYPFLSVLDHFKRHHVNVPQVLAIAPCDGLVLLEDLGDLTLERKFWESQHPESTILFYKMAVDELIKIHFKATQDKSDCMAFSVQFDKAKFLWEMNYGKENLLEGILNFQFNSSTHLELDRIFVDICTRLDQEPKYIAHRDYHSRNLMIKLDEMRVIDFQDARLGPIQYDLVSLIKDSYVSIGDSLAEEIIKDYLDKSREFLPVDFSRDAFDEIYELQSIQRCFKACGSFASFFHQRQDRRYLKYLPGTLKRY